jgi:hypothetical protein
MDRQSAFASVDYAKDGRPYICPDPDVYLGVYAENEYIKYGFRSTDAAKDFVVEMSDYNNGVCLGSVDTTLFAFTDRELGTRLLDTSGSSVTSLSDSTCVNYPCRPLVVLEGRYLALREKRAGDWYISLFDSHRNFSRLDFPHASADLMALADIESADICIPVVSSTDGTPVVAQGSVSVVAHSVTTQGVVLTPTLLPRTETPFSARAAAAIAAALVVAVVSTVAVVVGFALTIYMIRRQKVESTTLQENGNIGHEQRRDIESHMVAGMAIEESVAGVDITPVGEKNENKGLQESVSPEVIARGEKLQEMVPNGSLGSSDSYPLLDQFSPHDDRKARGFRGKRRRIALVQRASGSLVHSPNAERWLYFLVSYY